MSEYVPRGYRLLIEWEEVNGSSNSLRKKLISGEVKAFYLYHHEIEPIDQLFWKSELGYSVIKSGYYPVFFGLNNKPMFRELPVALKNEIAAGQDHSVVSPVAHEEEKQYLSPFIQMMIDGSRKMAVSASFYPKKEEAQEYFKSLSFQKVGEEIGPEISNSLAGYMATLIRPPEASKGGNKKVG